MVQAEIFRRVLRIVHENCPCTAFTIESHGEQFIVTAKHLFEDVGFPSSTTVKLLIGEDYQQFFVDIRYPADKNVDIAVMRLKPRQFLTPIFKNDNSINGLVYGQDVFFVGFPFEYDSILGALPGEKRPIPFVKKACVSAILNDEAGTILLDGINNPGFSGSPVCYNRIGSKDNAMSILGVVSGYRFATQPLFDQHGKQLDYFIKENTGIIVACDIKYAVQIADAWI